MAYVEDDLAVMQADTVLMSQLETYVNAGVVTFYVDDVLTSINEIVNMNYVPSAAFNFKGAIALAADFPTTAAVTNGDVYRITADVTDDDASKTNTSQEFLASSEIAWNGTNWTELGQKQGATEVAATPYDVLDTDGVILVDTVTVGATTVVNLPSAVGRKNREIIVIDQTGGANTDNIDVTPDGSEEIDGVAAAVSINVNFGSLALRSDDANWVTASGVRETIMNTTHRGSNGTDHANVVTNTSDIAAIVDDHIRSVCIGLDATTDEDEVSDALSGNVGDQFSPTFVVVLVTHVGGAIAADATLNIGTSSDGAEILSAQALTGLTTVGTQRHIPVPEGTFDILGNATLYANIESEDSTATTLTLDVYILGRQFTPTP